MLDLNAIDAATASAGDVIYVMPGHAETVSSATALAFNKSGISIIGLGNGDLRPTLTLDTATTTTIAVSAANISVEGIIFSANFADIVALFTIGAAKNFRVSKCSIRETATNMNFLYVFDTNTTDNAADGLTIS